VVTVSLSVQPAITKNFPITDPGKLLYIDVFITSTSFAKASDTWGFSTERGQTEPV
jgi:hypothetical protein